MATRLRVLHILEATLGGTRRYLEDIALATAAADVDMGLVFGTRRADANFNAALKTFYDCGWWCRPVDMRRAVSLSDVAAVVSVRRVIRAFSPDLIHCHSAKAGAIGRLAAG